MSETTSVVTTTVETVVEIFDEGDTTRLRRVPVSRVINSPTPNLPAQSRNPTPPSHNPLNPPSPHHDPSAEPSSPDNLQADLATFERVLLQPDAEIRLHVLATASTIIQQPEFAEVLKKYTHVVHRTARRAASEYSSASDTPPPPIDDEVLMELLDEIVYQAPDCGLGAPYTHSILHLIHSRYRSQDGLAAGTDDEGLGFAHVSSVCMGITQADEEAKAFEWRNALYFIEVHRQPPTGISTGRAAAEASRAPPPKGAFLTRAVAQAFSGLGNRRHAIGMVVQGFEVQIYYFDRVGCISSSDTLDMSHDGDLVRFVAIIINLSILPASGLGLEPSIILPEATAVSSPFGSIFDCQIRVLGRPFQLKKVLHSSDGLYGRGTAVYSAHPLPSPLNLFRPGDMPDEGLPDLVVVKLSWQETSQESEDRLFLIARQHNIQGLAQMYRSSVGEALSSGIRGALLSSRKDDYVDRELRIQVMGPMCMPLYKVERLEDFKLAFISLLKSRLSRFSQLAIHTDYRNQRTMIYTRRRGSYTAISVSTT